MEPDLLRIPVGGGASLHVERYGQGASPVVLLHGFGTSAFYWRAVAPALVELPRTVFAIDLLGYGDSDRPATATFDSDAQAEALEAAFTELRIARAPIVGNDIGGNVALRLAASRPDRVESLVLINTVLEGPLDTGALTELRRSTARHAVRLARSITGAAPLLRPLLTSSVADPARMPERLVARYLAPYVGKAGAQHLIGLARSVGEEKWLPDELPDGGPPILYVRGTADPSIDPGSVGRAVARFPLFRMVSVEGAGRLVAEDAPDALVKAIREHLDGS